VIFGIENMASAAIIALAMGPAVYAYFYHILSEILKSGQMLLKSCSNDINHLLRVLKNTNHKAYLLLLKAYVDMQHKKPRQPKKVAPIQHRKIIKHVVKKVTKLMKKSVAKAKKSLSKSGGAYKTAKASTTKKGFVKSSALSKTKAHKPSKAYALKAAFKELGKKEYMKVKAKSGAKHMKA
jgi:hypothetical protein